MGGIMKVKELIKKLTEINQELEVVLTIHNFEGDDYDYATFDDVTIDMGWGPSGVVSIEASNCVGNG